MEIQPITDYTITHEPTQPKKSPSLPLHQIHQNTQNLQTQLEATRTGRPLPTSIADRKVQPQVTSPATQSLPQALYSS